MERQNDMFMSLFNYITGKNETSAKIPMTVPVSMLNKKIGKNSKLDFQTLCLRAAALKRTLEKANL